MLYSNYFCLKHFYILHEAKWDFHLQSDPVDAGPNCFLWFFIACVYQVFPAFTGIPFFPVFSAWHASCEDFCEALLSCCVVPIVQLTPVLYKVSVFYSHSFNNPDNRQTLFQNEKHLSSLFRVATDYRRIGCCDELLAIVCMTNIDIGVILELTK